MSAGTSPAWHGRPACGGQASRLPASAYTLMKARAMILLALAITGLAPPLRADPPIVLGVAGRPRLSVPVALIGGESATLRLLADRAVTPAASSARLFQLAGPVAKPIETPLSLDLDPADPRVLLVRFTPPAVARASRLALQFDEAPPLILHVLPAGPREDRPALADALHTARLRVLVCGRSPELRAWLRSEKVDFDDLGVDPPERIPGDALLLGQMSEEDWNQLTATPAAATPLLAFVDSPGLLPGVYAESAARRAKVTLPILSGLTADPLARQTLHALILQSIAPANEPPVPLTQ